MIALLKVESDAAQILAKKSGVGPIQSRDDFRLNKSVFRADVAWRTFPSASELRVLAES